MTQTCPNLTGGPRQDALAGDDASALNATMAAIHHGLPGLFTVSFNVGQAGFGIVTVTFEVAPLISVGASKRIRQRMLALFRAMAGRTGTESEVAAALERVTAGLLEVTCAQVAVSIRYLDPAAPPQLVRATLACDASVSIDAMDKLILVLSDAAITLPGHPQLSLSLNLCLAPYLLNYLNQGVLTHVKLPALALPGADLALVKARRCIAAAMA